MIFKTHSPEGGPITIKLDDAAIDYLIKGLEDIKGRAGRVVSAPSFVEDDEKIIAATEFILENVQPMWHDWERTSLNGDGGSGNLFEWACLVCDRRQWSNGFPDVDPDDPGCIIPEGADDDG